MGHPPDHDGPLPDIYRSREAFFASLPAWRNAMKAILLFSSPWFWLVLVAGMALWIVAGLLGGLWTTIYDTLQEEGQPAPP